MYTTKERREVKGGTQRKAVKRHQSCTLKLTLSFPFTPFSLSRPLDRNRELVEGGQERGSNKETELGTPC